MKTSVPTIRRQAELKDAIVRELGIDIKKAKTLTSTEIIRLLADILSKTVQTGSFTLDAADWQPRVGITDDEVNFYAISME